MLLTIVIFLIVLAALIFVHELGHFLACRIFGIRVDEFALGFGPTIWKLKGKETTYAVRAIPFGGFVKIFGESATGGNDESMAGADSARSFVNAKRWKQAIVLCSGVLGNFIFAWLLVTIALSIGAAASPADYPQYANRMSDKRILIDSVMPGSPADKAGVKAGDVIAGLSAASVPAGQLMTIDTIQADIASSSGSTVIFLLLRDGKQMFVRTAAVKGVIQGEPDLYALGIAMDYAATLKLPWYTAVYESVRFNFYLMEEIYSVLGGLFQGKVSVSDLAGPVYIAQQAGVAAQVGFSSLVMFTAVISVNLGIVNLLPIPALDGGRLLFVVIEAVRRRPIKPAIANSLNMIGFALIMILMVFITYHDILRTIMQFYQH